MKGNVEKNPRIKDGCCALRSAFELHQTASDKMLAFLGTHRNTLLRTHTRTGCIRMMITPVLCI